MLKPYKDKYMLIEDFELDGIIVPKYFLFNGCSIPTIFYSVVGTPYDPRFVKSALIHDWLYYIHIIDKDRADKIFYNNLLRCGVNKAKALIMYNAVKMFGGVAWENNEQDKKDLARLKEKLKLDGVTDFTKYGWLK